MRRSARLRRFSSPNGVSFGGGRVSHVGSRSPSPPAGFRRLSPSGQELLQSGVCALVSIASASAEIVIGWPVSLSAASILALCSGNVYLGGVAEHRASGLFLLNSWLAPPTTQRPRTSKSRTCRSLVAITKIVSARPTRHKSQHTVSMRSSPPFFGCDARPPMAARVHGEL